MGVTDSADRMPLSLAAQTDAEGSAWEHDELTSFLLKNPNIEQWLDNLGETQVKISTEGVRKQLEQVTGVDLMSDDEKTRLLSLVTSKLAEMGQLFDGTPEERRLLISRQLAEWLTAMSGNIPEAVPNDLNEALGRAKFALNPKYTEPVEGFEEFKY